MDCVQSKGLSRVFSNTTVHKHHHGEPSPVLCDDLEVGWGVGKEGGSRRRGPGTASSEPLLPF